MAETRSEATLNQTSMELVGDREILISRAFNGPARIVFDAWTNPELVRRWWAPRSLGDTFVSCAAEVRVGGGYRYVLRSSAGGDMAFSGKYTEITPPSRLVYTQTFEPVAGADPMPGELIITVTFDERAGKTHTVSRTVCSSKEVRDGLIASGMETGMREHMEQLEELVASLR